MLTQSLLKELLHYDQDTGVFSWLVSPSRSVKTGDTAGNLATHGYVRIRVKGASYRAHRLVWLYVYGEFPTKEIDHVNGVKADNRLCNLRLATRSENSINQKIRSSNKSGFKGVGWHKHSQKWQAQCWTNGKRHTLGYFDTAEMASMAYQQFASVQHGEFHRGTVSHGKGRKPSVLARAVEVGSSAL